MPVPVAVGDGGDGKGDAVIEIKGDKVGASVVGKSAEIQQIHGYERP